jgi:hypothetical protein
MDDPRVELAALTGDADARPILGALDSVRLRGHGGKRRRTPSWISPRAGVSAFRFLR